MVGDAWGVVTFNLFGHALGCRRLDRYILKVSGGDKNINIGYRND